MDGASSQGEGRGERAGAQGAGTAPGRDGVGTSAQPLLLSPLDSRGPPLHPMPAGALQVSSGLTPPGVSADPQFRGSPTRLRLSHRMLALGAQGLTGLHPEGPLTLPGLRTLVEWLPELRGNLRFRFTGWLSIRETTQEQPVCGGPGGAGEGGVPAPSS